MSPVRILFLLIAGILAAPTALAFSAQQTLDRPAEFTASMDAALNDADVQREIKSAIRQEVTTAIERVASDGLLGSIATAIGPQAIADKAAEATDTQAFRDAWTGWSQLLFTGLAAKARGTADPQVVVSGSQVSVAIAPLVTPVIGDTLAGGLTGALDLFDASTTVTLDTGFPIGPVLTAAGRLAEARWLLLAALVVCSAIVVIGRRSALWLALLAVWVGLACAAVGGLVAVAQTRPPPGAEFPNLGLAITNALTGTWDNALFTVAILCAVLAALALLVDLLLRPRRVRPA